MQPKYGVESVAYLIGHLSNIGRQGRVDDESIAEAVACGNGIASVGQSSDALRYHLCSSRELADAITDLDCMLGYAGNTFAVAQRASLGGASERLDLLRDNRLDPLFSAFTEVYRVLNKESPEQSLGQSVANDTGTAAMSVLADELIALGDEDAAARLQIRPVLTALPTR